MELSVRLLLLRLYGAWWQTKEEKTLYKFISATILLENMLKTHEEQLEQNAYKYNQNWKVP